jgi:tetratricopeptide (TPR) repeat protein
MLPLGFYLGRKEVAAWEAAAAQQASWQDDRSAALEKLDRALQWDPESVEYLILRSRLYLELDQTKEALVDATQAFERSPESSVVTEAYCNALVRAGRGAEAAEVLDQRLEALNADEVDALMMMRNGVAYHLALADVELDRALLLTNLSLMQWPNEPSFLDTRAMVNLRRGQLDDALADIKLSIAGHTAQLAKERAKATAFSIDERHLEQQRKFERRSQAVLLYHRALIYEAQSKAAPSEEDRHNAEVSAALDRAAIRKLGFTADERLF